MLKLWSWRTLFGYLAACCIAALVLQLIFNTVAFGVQTFGHVKALAGLIAITTAVIGIVMLVPSVAFFLYAWGMHGPSAIACILFGGFSGAITIFIFAISKSNSVDATDLWFAMSFGGAGAAAGLVFWLIAVWPRARELPEAEPSSTSSE